MSGTGAHDKWGELAIRAMEESRMRLMMAFRFLDRALWKMPVVIADAQARLACSGSALHVEPHALIEAYRRNPDIVARAYLHSVLHCIFRHPFHTVRKEPQLWELACDICVEAMAVQLCDGRFALEEDPAIARFCEQLFESGCVLVPAQVYRELLRARMGPDNHALLAPYAANPLVEGALFARDSHELWDLVPPAAKGPGDEPHDPDAPRGHSDGSHDDAGSPDAEKLPDATREDEPTGANLGDSTSEDDETGAEGDGGGSESESDSEGSGAEGEGKGGATPPNQENASQDAGASRHRDAHLGDFDSAPQLQSLQSGGNPHGAEDDECSIATGSDIVDSVDSADRDEEEWAAIARQVETDLQTFSQQRGSAAGRMVDNLSLANRSTIDYAEFLRQFCTRAEDAKINDEEFDYLFYTYGLTHYGNMPLIEPLEYREEERLREFVIAIDTSGSCSRGLVDVFLTRTCEILGQANAARDRVNIRIIQCDAGIQEETVIKRADELRDFAQDYTIRGFGGTDFRPVFAHVDELVRTGEFTDLRGLIYFTDGMGTFPESAPAYDTAFVFVESAGKTRRVPPWACKVIMTEDEIEQLPPS